MSYKETVRNAAIAAARFAMPGIPPEAIQWREDPQKQQDYSRPNVVLSTVSHARNGDVDTYYSELQNGELQSTFGQRWFWTVQVRIEGWRADSKSTTNPQTFARNMRFGWKTLGVQRAIDDGDDSKPWQSRFPVKVVSGPGDLIEVTAPVSGHMLPQYLYEVELSYVEYATDTESVGVIESAEVQGHIGGDTAEDVVTLNTDNA